MLQQPCGPDRPGESGHLNLEQVEQNEATPPMDWWLREVDPYGQMPPARRAAEAERVRTDWQVQLQRVAAGRGSARRRHLSAVPAEVTLDSTVDWQSDWVPGPTALAPIDRAPLDRAPIDLSTEPTTELSLVEVFEVVETRTVRVTRGMARPGW